YLEGQVASIDQLVRYVPEQLEREQGIEVRTGTEVASIAHARRQVALAGGERLHYDRLVIATGARPDRSGIEGTEQPHVFTLSTMDDAARLKAFLAERTPRRAVVVGAGYLGLEMAEVLRAHGAAVTVFEAEACVLGRSDAALTAVIRENLERFGVELRTNERVAEIEPGAVNGMPCDLVVLCAGWRPNTEIAADAGIALGPRGAIRVSEFMETNLAGVYAAGDCAATTHLVTGQPVYRPLGTTANKMGRVAGANAAGRRERFPGIAGTMIARVCGVGIAVTGLSECQARHLGIDAVSAAIDGISKPRYFFGTPVRVELVAERGSGRLLGASVVAQEDAAGRIGIVAAALTSRMRLDQFEHLDLAYAPPFAPVWDPLLIAARQLRRLV
ncbi:MAG TPA: FAD-dependent oxidoreductase, partial [Bryobacteraceae bacterium]|nr:FAD-dependent oxidoreductase [Bryobacteraceae bacterium]